MPSYRIQTCVTAIRRFQFKYNSNRHNNASLVLKRDPNNPYDCNCINVYSNNKQIGYIKATDAITLAPLLDTLEHYTIQEWRVIKATSGYLVVKVRLVGS